MLEQLNQLESVAEEALILSSLLSLAMLVVELARRWFAGELRRLEIRETLSSLGALIAYAVGEIIARALIFAPLLYAYDAWISWALPVNVWTALLAVVVADFVFYWSHRLGHEVRFFWLAHAVHHSSPVFNSSVNFRLSILDALWSAPFFLPMLLLGFHPGLILFGQVIVLAYQSWIHTDLIGRLPVLDWIFNTPSNHRVHHGRDALYLDKNYGGVLMLWDHLFGTYQAEEHTPDYGLTKQINTQNPLRVQFSEFPALWRDLRRARSFRRMLIACFGPPA